MAPKDNEKIMKYSVNDVAVGLDLPISTIERWIRQGRIPVHKSGIYASFNQNELEKWAKKNNRKFVLSEKKNKQKTELKNESLLVAMERGKVQYKVQGDNVKSVFKSAVEGINISKQSREQLFHKLLARENLTSTGVGKGVAIPHPRTPVEEFSTNPVIVTCFLEKPIDFDAVDDLPVSVLFILLSSSVKVHLHLLSRLAFCVRDHSFSEFLKSVPDCDALFNKIAVFEEILDNDG